MNFDYIVYHKHCLDGITAAAAAYKYNKEYNMNYEFIPMDAGKTPEELLSKDNKNILFLDVCPTLDEYHKMLSNSCYVLIIDHHKTAVENFKNHKDKHIFDMNHSGAYLSWDFFYNLINDKFVLLIEDRDLWINKYPETKFLFNGLCDLLNHIDDSNSKIPMMLEYMSNYSSIIEKGSLIEEENNLYVESIWKNGYTSQYKDYKCYVMETKNFNCISDIGSRAYQDPQIDFSIVFYPKDHKDPNNNTYCISLRSNKDGKNIDVSQIAKEFGGGGHRNAAGFTMNDNPKNLFKPLE